MWTRHRQQQQRGVQFRPRKPGEAPAEAVEGRAAQDHEQAGVDAPVGASGYPASRLQDTDADNTPGAPDPAAGWDAIIQPERAPERADKPAAERDDPPLPEGK